MASRKALLIAFHFPPFSGSSGLQRTLRFTRYLPEFGWEPLVLSADPRAYPAVSTDLIPEVPAGTVVERAFALDAARHFAIAGKYLRISALPDRWANWWLAGVMAGRRLIHEHRPSVIMATYPIATAHVIGATLARMTGLPLVADYRDAMLVDDYPEDAPSRWAYARIERRVVRRASAAVFTTPQSVELYRRRYAQEEQSKFLCIRNGYDENDFLDLDTDTPRSPRARLRLVHSGTLKLSERDPRPFLWALADLVRAGEIAPGSIEVIFRAPADEEGHRRLIAEAGLTDTVRVEPSIPYADALTEMVEADALLIFQDALCNHLVPAKLYEYIRAQRPVLALTDERGETAHLIRESGAGIVVDLASREQIRAALPGFLQQVREGRAPRPTLLQARRYSRRNQAGELAGLFQQIVCDPLAGAWLPEK